MELFELPGLASSSFSAVLFPSVVGASLAAGDAGARAGGTLADTLLLLGARSAAAPRGGAADDDGGTGPDRIINRFFFFMWSSMEKP